MLVAVWAELFKLNPRGGVAPIFHGRVAGNPWRSLVGIGATLGAFQRNDNADTFTLSHNPTKQRRRTNYTQTSIISHDRRVEQRFF